MAAEQAGAYPAPSPFAPLTEAIASVQEVSTDGLAADQVADGLRLVTRLEGATAAVKAELVRTAQTTWLDRAKGERNTVQFLTHELRMSPGEAKRTAELARSLSALPGTREALAAGEISADQAHRISRAADRGILGERRVTEAQLLEAARTSTPTELGDEIRRREAAADGDRLRSDQRRAHSRRSLRTWTSRDGLGHGTWTADLATHELITTFIDSFTAPDGEGTPPEQQRSSEQRRFDGLAQGATVALGSGEARTVGKVRPHINVFVDHDTLLAAYADGSRAPDPDLVPAETATGPLCLDVLRRQLCDADVTTFITDGAKVLSVRPRDPPVVGSATSGHHRHRRALPLARLRRPSCLDTDPPRPIVGTRPRPHGRRQRRPTSMCPRTSEDPAPGKSRGICALRKSGMGGVRLLDARTRESRRTVRVWRRESP